MKALVTGGTGFSGSHLVKRLLERGDEVRVLDNKPGLFHDELRRLGAQITLGCVSDAELVERQVRGCDIVFHLAASFLEVNVSKAYYHMINVDGTRNVAEAAYRCGIRRLVNCSTCGVHGNIAHPPGDERNPIAPEDYYQLTKYQGEQVVEEYVSRGLEAVSLRPAAIYGPGDPQRFGLLFRMVKRGRFLMFGRGRTFYHPLYIDNLVDAFLQAANSRQANGQAYLIADEKYWSLNELVQQVARAIGVSVRVVHLPFWPLWWAAWLCEWACLPLRIAPPIFPRRVAWFRQDRAFSIDKARGELGYQPAIGIEEGLARTARWYEATQVI
jgi:nucleoside-diphosphate-sugar epimerase